MSEPVLCYIESRYTPLAAYFTTKPLAEQWGDDWNDAPYWCNAGPPYEHVRSGEAPHEVIVYAFNEGNFDTPEERGYDVSVEFINLGNMAWLLSSDPAVKPIMAGTPLSEFRRLLAAAGGRMLRRIADDNEDDGA